MQSCALRDTCLLPLSSWLVNCPCSLAQAGQGVPKAWRATSSRLDRWCRALGSACVFAWLTWCSGKAVCLQFRATVLLCRDIKPENIVLEGGKAGGQVRLVDFGGVQAAARNAEGAGGVGTTVIGKDRDVPWSPEVQVW